MYPLISPSVYHTLNELNVPVIQAIDDLRQPMLCPQGCFFRSGSVCRSCENGNYLHAVANRCIKNRFLVSSLYAATFGLNRRAGVREKIDGWVCMTGFFRDMLLEAGFPEEKIFVNPPFIDPGPRTAAEGKGDYALFFGRLSPEKGLWALLRAFERMRKRRLVIMGTGPLEAELKDYVREKELSNVEFAGFKSGEEKRRVIENCLFTIVPSQWYEIFGLVILEAWAAGKPVIGSNLGSIPYVIEDGKSGLVFEAGSSGDLEAKIDHLWTHPAEREEMGRRGRYLVETEYAPAKNYLRKQEIFRTTIGLRTDALAPGQADRMKLSDSGSYPPRL